MIKEKLALLGGSPAVNPLITQNNPPYPRFSEEAIKRVVELLEKGTTVGLNKKCEEIAEAESAIADWQGAAHCLGTASGHAALHSALIGLEISSGDEVITTPYTWGASVSCILHNNAIPIFADIDPVTGLLDPGSVESLISERTKAILVVHLFGQPANMTRIMEVAAKHNLKVIEDGSQAHGALHRGKKVGTFGDASGFSCMGGKLLASSEAGYMITPHEEVYWKASLGGQHMGRSPESGFPDNLRPFIDSLVYTYRLNPLNAVLLTEQLKKLDDEIASRRKAAARFMSLVGSCGSVQFPLFEKGDEPSYHLMTMIYNRDHAGVQRETYIEALKAEGAAVFSYVPSPIPRWNRLAGPERYIGPKVMWTENLHRY
ncbi:MAG: DegT/DnrJ/EryC1/StrS family aminotransferase, partial [Spirochaetales bacterium]|nr:DegT/DnrJ/EryC1/StrS family aminotransferase [Spirochaetales bacterium]